MKRILLGLIAIVIFLSLPTVSAIDTGQPLLNAQTEFGNCYSLVQSYMPWQTPPNVPECLNSEDAQLLGYYIDGDLTYRGTKTKVVNDITYSYYYWVYDADVPAYARLTAPQISEVQFNKRADLDDNGIVDSSDKLLLERFVNHEINSFPCCSNLPNQGISEQSIEETIGFIFLQMTVNPITTFMELTIMFIINLLVLIAVTRIIFPKLKIQMQQKKQKKYFRKLEKSKFKKIKQRISESYTKEFLAAAGLATISIFVVHAFFLYSITSGVIGYGITAVITFAIYAAIGMYMFKIDKKNTTEFSLLMTVISVIIWFSMSII